MYLCLVFHSYHIFKVIVYFREIMVGDFELVASVKVRVEQCCGFVTFWYKFKTKNYFY
jgi:hypothetical protein